MSRTTPAYLTPVAVSMTTSSLNPLRTPAGLKAWRAAHGLTQERLGELLEVTYVSIHRWETGKQAIPRLVELALLGLEHVVLAPPEAETAKALSAADELLLALGRERGLDVDSGVSEALRTMRAEVDNAADIEAAASGNRLAMIRLRKAVGLRAFR